ncbi:MAG: pyridoxamine 5'-phosphate oxidase family protein [Acidimicrobiales bacterium]
MSRIESRELPDGLLDLLSGHDLAGKVGETILLITVSESGWPHVAMLSAGEIVARSPAAMTMALWTGTETSENLRRGQATLVIVRDGAGHYIEASVRSADVLDVDGRSLDRFECEVERVLSDRVGYARLTSGITFELPDEPAVVERWERTVEAMTRR